LIKTEDLGGALLVDQHGEPDFRDIDSGQLNNFPCCTGVGY
jgi:hypothetical protein